jgi:hypothetical protein
MAHYAKVNNEKVEKVIVADKDFIDKMVDDSPGRWIETSYNGNFRKNYAGIGYTYDKSRDAFIPHQPFNSWLLNEDTCRWDAPTPYPEDGTVYEWDESKISWKEATISWKEVEAV